MLVYKAAAEATTREDGTPLALISFDSAQRQEQDKDGINSEK